MVQVPGRTGINWLVQGSQKTGLQKTGLQKIGLKMGSGQSTKRQKSKTSSPFDRDPKDRRSLKCFRKSNGSTVDKGMIRSRSASTSSLGQVTRPSSLPHLPLAYSTPVKKPVTMSPPRDGQVDASWSRITMTGANDESRISEGSIGTGPVTPSSSKAQTRNNSMTNNSMANNSMANNIDQSPSRSLNRFIFEHHQQQALSNIARNSLKELNEKAKREIFEENYRIIRDYLMKHYSPDPSSSAPRNSRLFDKGLRDLSRDQSSIFDKGLRDLSRDQSSISSSHEASSVSTRSSTSEQNRESNKSLPKTREELQELVSIELRLKALIDYCCSGSGTSVQPGDDSHSRGSSFSQQLVTVTETAAPASTTTTTGVLPASNGISSVNNSVTRINTIINTRINSTLLDSCRGNGYPNEGGVINGVKSVSFKLSNHQDGGGGGGGGGGRDLDSSLNLSLEKVCVLIRERKSYLEKRLELESLHSKAVRELIRDPSTPSLIMASLQNWNPIGHVLNPAIPSHPMTASGHSVLNGSAPKLRKPRALSLVESADGNFGFDSSSYCNLMQDVKDVKTLLFRLQGLLQLVSELIS